MNWQKNSEDVHMHTRRVIVIEPIALAAGFDALNWKSYMKLYKYYVHVRDYRQRIKKFFSQRLQQF